MSTTPRSSATPAGAAHTTGSGAAPSPVGASGLPRAGADTRGATPRKGVRSLTRARVLLGAAAAGALALTPLAAASPALAAGQGGTPASSNGTSTVGGPLLGRSGTQVHLGKGAPQLPKGLSGKSWMISDAQSGEVLAAHNAHRPLPPASTLKMLFADTVLPHFKSTQRHTVRAKDLAGMGAGSSLVGIKENLSYSVHDLWLGVFLRSGNDAVHTLASMYGGVPKTVAGMREEARKLNALDTHVVTPDGYDAKGQVSSAYDLSLFARQGLQNADFRKYCSTATANFPGDVGKHGKRASFQIQNTDRLLTGDYGLPAYKGLAGVKNGYTTNAGNTFTGVAQRGDRVLLVTVMNPQTPAHDEVYHEAANLLDWGFKAAPRVEPVGRLVAPGAAGLATAPPSSSPSHSAGQARASVAGSGGGALTAVGIAAGVVVVVGGGAWLVTRRWPRPGNGRRGVRS